MPAVGTIVTILMVIFIGIQSCNIWQQTSTLRQDFEIGKRPYLYVEVEPLLGAQTKAGLFAGATMIYKNVGPLPASKTNTETKIDCFPNCKMYDADVAKWYKGEYGTYPYIVTLFPNQKSYPQRFHPAQSPLPENSKRWIYFGVRIKYRGDREKDKSLEYFYWVDSFYLLARHENDANGNSVFEITPLKNHADWDKNEQGKMPKLKADWEWVKNSNLYKRYQKDILGLHKNKTERSSIESWCSQSSLVVTGTSGTRSIPVGDPNCKNMPNH